MIMENSISSFLNSRSMTKIDAFKLEFYCCRVAIQPHRSRVLKTKIESYKLDFFGLEEKQNLQNVAPIQLEKKEEEQSDLGGRSGAAPKKTIWLEKKEEEQSDLVLVGDLVFFFFFFFSMFSSFVFSFSPWICSSSCVSTHRNSSL